MFKRISILLVGIAMLMFLSACSNVTVDISDVYMTSDMDEDNEPVDEVRYYSPDATAFYVYGEIDEISEPIDLIAIWYYEDEEIESDKIRGLDDSDYSFDYQLDRDDELWEIGDYLVEFFVNDEDNDPIESVDFKVKGETPAVTSKHKLKDFLMTLSIDTNDKPLDRITELYTDTPEIYIFAEIDNIEAGTVFTISNNLEGSIVTTEIIADEGDNFISLHLEIGQNPWVEGDYEVKIFEGKKDNAVLLGILEFKVLSSKDNDPSITVSTYELNDFYTTSSVDADNNPLNKSDIFYTNTPIIYIYADFDYLEPGTEFTITDNIDGFLVETEFISEAGDNSYWVKIHLDENMWDIGTFDAILYEGIGDNKKEIEVISLSIITPEDREANITFSKIYMTSMLDENEDPVDEITSYNYGTTELYFYGNVQEISGKFDLIGIWYYENEEFFRSALVSDINMGYLWFVCSNTELMPIGNYEFKLFMNDEDTLLARVPFDVIDVGMDYSIDVSGFTMTSEVTEDGEPMNTVSEFASDIETIYAYCEILSLEGIVDLTSVWYSEDEILTYYTLEDIDTAQPLLFHLSNDEIWTTGEYAIGLFANDESEPLIIKSFVIK